MRHMGSHNPVNVARGTKGVVILVRSPRCLGHQHHPLLKSRPMDIWNGLVIVVLLLGPLSDSNYCRREIDGRTIPFRKWSGIVGPLAWPRPPIALLLPLLLFISIAVSVEFNLAQAGTRGVIFYIPIRS